MTTDRPQEEEHARPVRVRPAGVFRAAVLAALATLPAAGCYESVPLYGDPFDDAADTADATDAADAEDAAATEDAAADFLDSVLAYAVPTYGVPEP